MKVKKPVYVDATAPHIVMEYDVSNFADARIEDGKLVLAMYQSGTQMFSPSFEQELEEQIGREEMLQILDKAGHEVHRQVAIRMLLS